MTYVEPERAVAVLCPLARQHRAAMAVHNAVCGTGTVDDAEKEIEKVIAIEQRMRRVRVTTIQEAAFKARILAGTLPDKDDCIDTEPTMGTR